MACAQACTPWAALAGVPLHPLRDAPLQGTPAPLEEGQEDASLPEEEHKAGRPGAHLLKHAVTDEARAAATAALGKDTEQAGKAVLQLRCVRTRGMEQQGPAAWPPAKLVAATATRPRCTLCRRRRQPDLRAMFTRVFGVTTASGNNEWMRGKLMQGACCSVVRWHGRGERRWQTGRGRGRLAAGHAHRLPTTCTHAAVLPPLPRPPACAHLPLFHTPPARLQPLACPRAGAHARRRTKRRQRRRQRRQQERTRARGGGGGRRPPG